MLTSAPWSTVHNGRYPLPQRHQTLVSECPCRVAVSVLSSMSSVPVPAPEWLATSLASLVPRTWAVPGHHLRPLPAGADAAGANQRLPKLGLHVLLQLLADAAAVVAGLPGLHADVLSDGQARHQLLRAPEVGAGRAVTQQAPLAVNFQGVGVLISTGSSHCALQRPG